MAVGEAVKDFDLIDAVLLPRGIVSSTSLSILPNFFCSGRNDYTSTRAPVSVTGYPIVPCTDRGHSDAFRSSTRHI